MVLEFAQKDDPAALRVLRRAIDDVEEALAALKLRPDDWLCLHGGLAGLYAPYLSEDFRALLKPPLQDALGGAISMAARHFGGGRKVADV